MSTKEAILEVIRRMPDDATVADLIAALYPRHQGDDVLRQLEDGQGITHEEVKRRLAKWLD